MLAARFGALHHTLVNVFPAVLHVTVGFDNQAKSTVVKLDQRAAGHFAEAVLEVVGHWMGHEERAADFYERRLLDGLHRAPTVAVPFSQIPEPAVAGPRFGQHG